MKIAVPFENENIFGHFGHTSAFKIYEIENGKITAVSIMPTLGGGHGALAGFLASLNVDTLICGGIGGGAKNALTSANIAVYGGASGNADAAVHAFLAGKLEYDPNVQCNHHSHNHGDGHDCGGHCH